MSLVVSACRLTLKRLTVRACHYRLRHDPGLMFNSNKGCAGPTLAGYDWPGADGDPDSVIGALTNSRADGPTIQQRIRRSGALGSFATDKRTHKRAVVAAAGSLADSWFPMFHAPRIRAGDASSTHERRYFSHFRRHRRRLHVGRLSLSAALVRRDSSPSLSPSVFVLRHPHVH